MRTTTGKLIFWTYLVLFAIAITWPGMIPFDHIRPFVFGLPFSLFWVALWVALGAFALWAVERSEKRSGRGG